MTECPTCGRTFDTRRGLGVHHSSVHGERLPNRKCGKCREEFYSPYEKVYCSPECHSSSVSNRGADNPNYRGAKKRTSCNLCDTEFEYYPSAKSGYFCPDCVDQEDWRTLPTIDGDRNPRWNGGKTTFHCDVCADPVERYQSEVNDVVLCSDSCKRTWLSDEFTGDGHPNWKGGGNEAYGPGWAAVRAAALERDGYRCVICSRSSDQIGRNPDVHHIIPVRAFIESDRHQKADAHTLANVISLCIGCHRRADFGRISRKRLRFLIGESVGSPRVCGTP